MTRHIMSQGDLDGACFLYSLANAFVALTKQPPELDRWDHAITSLRWPSEFQKATVGTTNHYRKDPMYLTEAAESVLGELSHGRFDIHVERLDHPDMEAIATVIDARSVVLLWYQGDTHYHRDGDHWVCAVHGSRDPLRLDIACSIRYLDAELRQAPYEEISHGAAHRCSNDFIDPSMHTTLMRDCVLHVSLATAGE